MKTKFLSTKCKVPKCRLHSDKGNLCAWYRDIIQCAEWRNYKDNNKPNED